MPYDPVYEDLVFAYLDLGRQHEEAVAVLIALQKEGDHSAFARTHPLVRELAAQVKAARERIEAHRLASPCLNLRPRADLVRTIFTEPGMANS